MIHKLAVLPVSSEETLKIRNKVLAQITSLSVWDRDHHGLGGAARRGLCRPSKEGVEKVAKETAFQVEHSNWGPGRVAERGVEHGVGLHAVAWLM